MAMIMPIQPSASSGLTPSDKANYFVVVSRHQTLLFTDRDLENSLQARLAPSELLQLKQVEFFSPSRIPREPQIQ